MSGSKPLKPYSPSEWEYGRMQGNLEAQISNLQNELQTLASATDGLEQRIRALEKEVDQQKTKLILLISGISLAVTVGIQITIPVIDKIFEAINKSGN